MFIEDRYDVEIDDSISLFEFVKLTAITKRFWFKEKDKAMTVNRINSLKVPIFKVNPALNALLDVPMFEDKIAEANEILRTVGLPDSMSLTSKKSKNAKKIMKKQTVKKVLVK